MPRCTLVLALVVASTAAAQDTDTDVHGPGGYAWAEAGVFVEQDRGPRVAAISPLVGADYWIKRLVEVRARFGWSGVRLSSDEVTGPSRQRWRWSNLLLGASYRREIADYYPYVFELSAGLDVAIPTARADDDPHLVEASDDQVLRQASTMRGVRDLWLWSPDHWSIVVPLAARLVHDYAHVKVEGDIALMLPLDASTQLVFQFLGEAGYWVQRKLLLALALSVAMSPSGETYDDAAAVSGAFRSVLKMDPVRFHLDIWLNLNNFRTFTLAGSRWGVILGIGVALPGT